MTCIAIIRDDNGKLWMAGDRRLSYNNRYLTLVRPKVAKRNGILVGAAGTSHLCTELVDLFKFPKPPKKQSEVFNYAHNILMPKFLKHLKKKGDLALAGEAWKDTSMIALLGIGTEVYELEINEGVPSMEIVDAPTAVGSGSQVALGALMVSPSNDPAADLFNALNTVSDVKFCCDNKIDIIHN